jgi:hypothetical protein
VPCLIRRASFHAAGISTELGRIEGAPEPILEARCLDPSDGHGRGPDVLEDVRAAAMAVGRVEASGLKDWLGGALNAAQLGADTGSG